MITTAHEYEIKERGMSDDAPKTTATSFPSVPAGPAWKAIVTRKMKEAGDTQAQLAAQYGLQQGRLSRFLNDEKDEVTSSTWTVPLAQHYKVPMAYDWFALGEQMLELDERLFEQFDQDLRALVEHVRQGFELQRRLGKSLRYTPEEK